MPEGFYIGSSSSGRGLDVEACGEFVGTVRKAREQDGWLARLGALVMPRRMWKGHLPCREVLGAGWRLLP